MLLMDFGVVGGRVKHILLEREHNFPLAPGTFLLFVHFAWRLRGGKGGCLSYPLGARNNGISLSYSFSLHLPGRDYMYISRERLLVGGGVKEVRRESVCVY
jgi:hypothetical protein